MITVKKRILENFIQNIVEARSSGHSDVTKTMKDLNFDDTPIRPSNHMSMQISVEAPPVDDEDYLPGTRSELSRATALIANEVEITLSFLKK